jgi:hypothetical protein
MLRQGRDLLGIDLAHIVFLGSVKLHAGQFQNLHRSMLYGRDNHLIF